VLPGGGGSDGGSDGAPVLIAHVNALGGIAYTYFDYEPIDLHEPWQALEAAQAWSASTTEETWSVCGYARCFCRRRAGSDLVGTWCYDVSYAQGGDPDIGMNGWAIVTATDRTTGYPRCMAADYNCPTPGNPKREPWH